MAIKKVIAGIAVAVIAATSTGCTVSKLDPNTVEIILDGNHAGAYHCINQKYQPPVGNPLGLNPMKWYNEKQIGLALGSQSELYEDNDLFSGALTAVAGTALIFGQGYVNCEAEGKLANIEGKEDRAESSQMNQSFEQVPQRPIQSYPEFQNELNIPQPVEARIPKGKALFTSGRTGNKELISVSLSKRVNTNGHVVYDAVWSDGYQSSYVFWSNGHAEIFSTNGQGNNERTASRFTRLSNGNLRLIAETDSITEFPQFNPITN